MDETRRALLRRARDRLDEWLFEARDRAYQEFSGGEEPRLDDADLRRLDELDSALGRQDGEGVWGTDEYGVVTGWSVDDEFDLRVVCTRHPEIPEYANDAVAELPDAERERFNAVLWDYAERVAELLNDDLDAFVREVDDERGRT